MLTEITIKQLPVPPHGFKIYPDKQVPGFGVRVTENGARSYVLTYGPKRKRVTLGSVGIVKLADARQKAKDILAEYQLSDGEEETTLFDTALDTFMRGYAEKNKPSTVKETERLLRRHLEPLAKGRTLQSLKKAEIVKLLDAIEKKSQRRHVYTAAHTFFRWCRRYDIRNPLEGVEKPAKSPPRTRLLLADELRAIWNAPGAVYAQIMRILIVTGQRLKQISHLHSDYIDRGNKTITWPASLMKSNKPFIFPYGELTHSLLPQGEGLLFTTEEGRPFNDWSDSHNELMAALKIPHFVRHDCRRFYSTTHSQIGTQPHIRELLLSHAFGTEVSRTYDLYTYLDEKRTAQLNYERHLATLIAPRDQPQRDA